MRKLKLTNETIEIYRMLDFYLRYIPLGLLPFMDSQYPLPSSRDIAEALNAIRASDDLGVRVSGGKDVPEAQRIVERMEPFAGIIERNGGIKQIREVFRDWEVRWPHKAQIIRQWSLKGGRTMSDIVGKNGYQEVSSVYKVRRSYLMDIAYDIYIRRYVIIGQ